MDTLFGVRKYIIGSKKVKYIYTLLGESKV